MAKYTEWDLYDYRCQSANHTGYCQFGKALKTWGLILKGLLGYNNWERRVLTADEELSLLATWMVEHGATL